MREMKKISALNSEYAGDPLRYIVLIAFKSYTRSHSYARWDDEGTITIDLSSFSKSNRTLSVSRGAHKGN